MDLSSGFWQKKWGILIKKESESLVFTGLEIPRDYITIKEVKHMEKDIESVRQARSSFNRILSNSIYADIIKDDAHLEILLNLLNGNNYKSILDIGTGTGYLAFPLAKIHPTAQVRGIDIAEKVIEQNVERAKEQNYVNLSFHSFDGIEYPFEKESFDLIVTRYAFHHFPNIKNSIQQMKNLLNSGGKLLISDPLRHLNDDNHMIDDFMRIKKMVIFNFIVKQKWMNYL